VLAADGAVSRALIDDAARAPASRDPVVSAWCLRDRPGVGMLALARHCASFVRHYGIVASLREIGPLIRELLFRSEERAERADGFDARRGTNTSGMVMPWELADQTDAPGDGNPYASLTSDRIRSLIGAAMLMAGEMVFVDLGSGKGRALLVAGEYPFKRIVGVEWSRELDAVARSNIAVASGGGAPDPRFELLRMDAGEYDFPADPLVIFMFNPFGVATMTRVVANLERTLAEHPRRVAVIYANPVHGSLLAHSQALHPVVVAKDHAIYESRVT
jgi:hypothetical protein